MPTTSAAQHPRSRRLLRLFALLLFVAATVAGPSAHADHFTAEADRFGAFAGGDLAGGADAPDHDDAHHTPDACAVCLGLAGAALSVPADAPGPVSVRSALSPDRAGSLLSVLPFEDRRARAPPIA